MATATEENKAIEETSNEETANRTELSPSDIYYGILDTIEKMFPELYHYLVHWPEWLSGEGVDASWSTPKGYKSHGMTGCFSEREAAVSSDVIEITRQKLAAALVETKYDKGPISVVSATARLAMRHISSSIISNIPYSVRRHDDDKVRAMKHDIMFVKTKIDTNDLRQTAVNLVKDFLEAVEKAELKALMDEGFWKENSKYNFNVSANAHKNEESFKKIRSMLKSGQEDLAAIIDENYGAEKDLVDRSEYFHKDGSQNIEYYTIIYRDSENVSKFIEEFIKYYDGAKFKCVAVNSGLEHGVIYVTVGHILKPMISSFYRGKTYDFISEDYGHRKAKDMLGEDAGALDYAESDYMIGEEHVYFIPRHKAVLTNPGMAVRVSFV